MRFHAVLSFAAVILTAASCKSSGPATCDASTLEDAMYCVTCKVMVEVETGEEAGVCRNCNNAPDERKVCVRKVYWCSAHKAYHAEPCPEQKDKKCCSERDMKSLVSWKCPGCGAASEEPGSCGTCEKALEKTCEGSGTWPHGGSPPK